MSVGAQTTSIKEKSLKFEREHYLELLIRIRHLNQHIFFSELGYIANVVVTYLTFFTSHACYTNKKQNKMHEYCHTCNH